MQVNIQNKNFTLLEIQGKVIGQDALVLKTMLEEHIQKLEAQDGDTYADFRSWRAPRQWIVQD